MGELGRGRRVSGSSALASESAASVRRMGGRRGSGGRAAGRGWELLPRTTADRAANASVSSGGGSEGKPSPPPVGRGRTCRQSSAASAGVSPSRIGVDTPAARSSARTEVGSASVCFEGLPLPLPSRAASLPLTLPPAWLLEIPRPSAVDAKMLGPGREARASTRAAACTSKASGAGRWLSTIRSWASDDCCRNASVCASRAAASSALREANSACRAIDASSRLPTTTTY